MLLIFFRCLTVISFSRFAVFATLGYLAHIEGLDSIAELEYGGFGLVFGSWPVALVSHVIYSIDKICLSVDSDHQVTSGYTPRRRTLDPSSVHYAVPAWN